MLELGNFPAFAALQKMGALGTLRRLPDRKGSRRTSSLPESLKDLHHIGVQMPYLFLDGSAGKQTRHSQPEKEFGKYYLPN